MSRIPEPPRIDGHPNPRYVGVTGDNPEPAFTEYLDDRRRKIIDGVVVAAPATGTYVRTSAQWTTQAVGTPGICEVH